MIRKSFSYLCKLKEELNSEGYSLQELSMGMTSDYEIAIEEAVTLGELRDAALAEDCYIKPEWVIVLGICTHLGCVPLNNAGEYHGWFCPCHGSHYDTCGRIRKGPAPLNLEIPPYKFIDEAKVLIG